MSRKSASTTTGMLGATLLLLGALGLAGAPAPPRPSAAQEAGAGAARAPSRAPPTELCEVVKVVDADTLHVLRGGALEKLRLASVDTEEKLAGNPSASATKPETLFGEECAVWARELFASLPGDGPPKVGVLLPGGVERRDTYGRLLCHVLLPDGTDFNLLLVEEGRSPYFDKYGNSEVCHAAFVAAEERAQKAQLGIWNPATNRPLTPGAPAALRPYDRLLPWWQARADAVEAFRARAAQDPEGHADAEDPASLARALAACERDPGRSVEVFGTPERSFDERDGSWTLLFRSSDRANAFRARVAAAERAALLPLDLAGSMEDFRQNYWSVTGRLVRGPRGYELAAGDPKRWKPGGPEPRLPPAKTAAGAGR